MKKNFFKKLSFVLALAMIVTALAPAAGAFAAKAPKLNASTKTLHLGVDGKDEFDFNISNKVTGWKYLWSSANKNVVSVNKKNGLATAEAAGKTKISVVITDKKGEEVDELTATVTVRDNIKDLTITNLPKDGQVAVGVGHDFNRSYVTVANKTKGSQAITRWSVSPEGASIDDKGVFTATKAGEYTITARAFQSKAKYTSWLSDATKYASYVTAEATYKVKAAGSMVEAKQVDLDTFNLSFDSEVTDTSKISIVRLVGTTEVVELAKKVTLSEDKKVATVDMYNDFAAGATYVVRYTDMKDVKFVAATTKVEDVKEIKILTNQVQVFESTEIKIALLNADGVNIATSDLLTRVTLETADTNLYIGNNKEVTMYTIGNTATITAKFHTWKYDGGTEVGALEVKGVLTCVEKVLDKATSIVASDVATSWDNFKKVNHTIAVDDNNFKLYVKALIKKANGDDDYKNNNDNQVYGVDGWEMSSSNTSVLLVDNQGNLTPVGIGSASVIVKWDEVVVGSIAITVGARREVSVVTLNTNSFTLSNDDDVIDNKTVEVTVKDQYGDKMDGGKYSVAIDRTSNPANGPYITVNPTATPVANSTGSQKYLFENPNNVESATGTYVYKITAKDTTSGKAMPTYVTVTVAKPTSDTVSTSYRLEADATTVDMKLNEWSGNNDAKVTVSLFGYASNGVRNQRIALSDAAVSVDILGAGNGYEGKVFDTAAVTLGTNMQINLTPATGGKIVKADKGSWTVTAASGNAITGYTFRETVTFGVTDTQEAPTYTFDSPYVTVDNFNENDIAHIKAAIDKAVTFNLKGDEILVADLVNIDYSVVGKTIYLRSVQYHEVLSNSNYILHTINLGKTITVK